MIKALRNRLRPNGIAGENINVQQVAHVEGNLDKIAQVCTGQLASVAGNQLKIKGFMGLIITADLRVFLHQGNQVDGVIGIADFKAVILVVGAAWLLHPGNFYVFA